MSDDTIIIELTDEVFPVLGHEVVSGAQAWGALRRVSPAQLAELDLLRSYATTADNAYNSALKKISKDKTLFVTIEEARNGHSATPSTRVD